MRVSNNKRISNKLDAANKAVANLENKNNPKTGDEKVDKNDTAETGKKTTEADEKKDGKSDNKNTRKRHRVPFKEFIKPLITPYWVTVAVLIFLIFIFSIMIKSTAFCNAFTAKVLPIFLNTYGRFTNLFSFSFGEVLLSLVVPILLAVVIMLILMIFLRKNPIFAKINRVFFKSFFMIFLSVCLIMILNCSIPYGCSELEVKKNDKNYSVEQLEILRNYIVEQCNDYSEKFDRDDKGEIIYNTSVKDITKEAKASMHRVSKEYDFPRLAGYYPNMKPIRHSVLMSQAGTMGIFFPFSLESNYNPLMSKLNFPATFCHEYSHLKGYMQEDEANFIAYLACLGSEDLYFQYSAYLSVLHYVDNEYYKNVDKAHYEKQIPISENASRDSDFLTESATEKVEKEAVIDTKTVSEASNKFTESYLDYYDVKDGLANYDRVTDLLLQFYDGKLY